jgi:hypothetical protein
MGVEVPAQRNQVVLVVSYRPFDAFDQIIV